MKFVMVPIKLLVVILRVVGYTWAPVIAGWCFIQEREIFGMGYAAWLVIAIVFGAGLTAYARLRHSKYIFDDIDEDETIKAV